MAVPWLCSWLDCRVCRLDRARGGCLAIQLGGDVSITSGLGIERVALRSSRASSAGTPWL